MLAAYSDEGWNIAAETLPFFVVVFFPFHKVAVDFRKILYSNK